MMAILVLLTLVTTLCYGGWRLSRELRVVKVFTIRGGLFAVVCCCRFLIYAGCLFLGIFFMILVFIPAENRSYSIGHEFGVEIDEAVYEINRVDSRISDNRLQYVRGTVRMPEMAISVLVVVAAVVSLGAWLLHRLFRHAEQLLLSLYKRAPFTADNARHAKQIALLIVAVWCLDYAYMVGMTLYLQSRLETEGITLVLTDLPVVQTLFTAGVVFVLSEVFRLGHELEEEQEYTV